MTANPKEVYSIYVLAYAQKEARPYGEFDKTLASSLGCIHARTEEMLMPSELAAKMGEMGADQPDDDDDCDVGPSARDRRIEAEAHARLSKLILAGGHVETGGRSLYESAGDEIVRLRAHVERVDKDYAALFHSRESAGLARIEGAAEMRERAADALQRMKNGIKDIMARTALQDAVNAVRTLPLSGAPPETTAHPLDADAPARRRDATKAALMAMGVDLGRAGEAARIAEEEGGAAPEAAHSAVLRLAKEHGLTFGWGGQDLRARLRRMLQQGAAGERAAARLEPEVLSSQDVDALVDAMWWRDGDIWRDPRGLPVDPRSAEGVALMRSVAKDVRERKARGPRLIETPADGLSAEDAETLRGAGWEEQGDGMWVKNYRRGCDPMDHGLFNPRTPSGIQALRERAGRILVIKAPPAASGVTGEASGGDRAAGGEGSVAEAQGEKQGAPTETPLERAVRAGATLRIETGTSAGPMLVRATMPDGTTQTWELHPCRQSAPPAPAALPKPARVDVGQRWSVDWRDLTGEIDEYTADAVNDDTARLLGGKKGVSYRPTAELLTSLRWTFLGPAPTPQGPSPKRDDVADMDADVARMRAALDRPTVTAEPTDGPTARDAVAGMLLRAGWGGIASDLSEGEKTPAQARARLMAQPDLGAEDRACIAALEALARGVLKDPANWRRVADLHLNTIKGAKERLGADENEGLWMAADRVKQERDEARAEATALREEVERMTGRAADLERQRDEACKDALEAMRELRALKADASPPRPAEDIAREMVSDAGWIEDERCGIALHSDVTVGIARGFIARLIERSRAEGKRASVESDTVHAAATRAVYLFGGDRDGMFSGACFSRAFCDLVGLVGPIDGRVVRGMLSGRRDVEVMSDGYRLIDRAPVEVPAEAPSGMRSSGDDGGDDPHYRMVDVTADPFGEAPSGRRIEKREHPTWAGDWLVDAPALSGCKAQGPVGGTCTQHHDGYHLATGPAIGGAEPIYHRWPIAPSQDEPQVTGALPVIVNIGTLTFAGREASDAEKAHVVAWLNAELQTLTFGEDRVHDSIHILRNADSSVRVWMPKDADSRAVLATVAELLGLSDHQDEARALSDLRRTHHADRDDEPADIDDRWQHRRERLSRATHGSASAFERAYLHGMRDAYTVAGVEMRRARGQVASPTGAPDREALGRAVHDVFAGRGSGTERWEERTEHSKELLRLVGERLFAMGVAEGERRAEEKARATARDLLTSWEANRVASLRLRSSVQEGTPTWARRDSAAIIRRLCMLSLSDAFGVPLPASPTDDQPPTGGEPAPETHDVDMGCARPTHAGPKGSCRLCNPEAHAADTAARWQPGAVWEHLGPPSRTIEREEYDMVFFTDGTRIARLAMTEANGWRYVGPGSSPGGNGMEADGAQIEALFGAQPETTSVPGGCQVIPSGAESSTGAACSGRAPVVPGDPSAIERAHADGIVEGLRRASRELREQMSVAGERYADALHRALARIEADAGSVTPADLPHVDRAAEDEEPPATHADSATRIIDLVTGYVDIPDDRYGKVLAELRSWFAAHGARTYLIKPNAARAALLELATGWEREATQRRQKVRDAARVAMNQDITWSSTLASADALDRCAADLRRLLDAPRGGERVEAPREPDYRDGEAEGQRQGRERAQELAERWRRRASNPAAPSPVTAALEVCAFELSEEFGLDPEGAEHEPSSDDTSTPAAQDGSSEPHGSSGAHSADALPEGKV